MIATECHKLDESVRGASPPRELPVLFADHEPEALAFFRSELGGEFRVLTASSGLEALEILESEPVGVLAADERMPGLSGTELLVRVVERWPDTLRILFSAGEDAGRLSAALHQGYAHEYALKPWASEDLHACVQRAHAMAERRRALAGKAPLAFAVGERHATRGGLIGRDAGLKSTCALATRAALCNATVLIKGETGTGKELIARFIHERSERASKPFVAVNCAALPEGLIESELFGHERGAFTGAKDARKGRFELAQGGTLFLDEIGDISPRVQLALLRVLQERQLERVGATTSISLDVRVVVATHRDLGKLVVDGSFREDLYYRLNVIPLSVPPLRERIQDLSLLLQHFIQKWAATDSRRRPPRIGAGVLQALRAHCWPGNVRELENLVQRALVMSDSDELTLEHLAPASAHRPNGISVRAELEQAETARLREVLWSHDGNISRAARTLGIPRTTLASRAKRARLT